MNNVTLIALIILIISIPLSAWEKYEGNPVLEPVLYWAWMALSDPSIICIPGGGCLLVYTAAGHDSIHGETLTRPGAAWSSDGFDWVMSEGPVMMNGYPGTWDSAAAETPGILFDGDSIILMYAGEREHGGGQLAIGIASSHDGGASFTRLAEGPVFTRDTTRPEEYRAVESPTILRMGDSLIMWYNAQSIDWHITVCRASSYNGIIWHRYPGNPVMDIGDPGEFDEIGVYSPCVRYIDDSLGMLYQGFMLGDTSYMFDSTFLGWATSTDGGFTWRRSPDNPVLGPGPPGSWDENGPKIPSYTHFGDGILGIYWNAIDGKLGLFTHSFTNIGETTVLPDNISFKAYPNPFNSECRLRIADCGSKLRGITVYDINGRMVADFRPDGNAGPGRVYPKSGAMFREFVWQPDDTDVSGVYLIRIISADYNIIKRIVYMK